MTIRSVRLVPYRLPLRDPWPTAEGPVLDRHGCLLILEEEDGRLGLGDAAPLPGFGLETIGSCVAVHSIAVWVAGSKAPVASMCATRAAMSRS